MEDQSNEELYLVSPPILKDDVDQEMELLRLEGKVPNRSIILKKMLRYDALLYDFSNPAIDSCDVLWPGNSESQANLEAIEILVDWALTQSDQISKLIFDFLSDDITIDDVMKELKDHRIVRSTKTSEYQPRTTLTEVILNHLDEHEMSIYSLYDLGRNFLHNSRRPEAAVRQILRRLIQREVVKKEYIGGTDVYSLS